MDYRYRKYYLITFPSEYHNYVMHYLKSNVNNCIIHEKKCTSINPLVHIMVSVYTRYTDKDEVNLLKLLDEIKKDIQPVYVKKVDKETFSN